MAAPRLNTDRIQLRTDRRSLRALADLADRLRSPSANKLAADLVAAAIQWVNDPRDTPAVPERLVELRAALGRRTRQAELLDRLDSAVKRLEKLDKPRK